MSHVSSAVMHTANSVLVMGSGVGSAGERQDRKFVSAVRRYRAGDWQEAFEQFSTLADSGNLPAAKVALLMLRHGSPIYGRAFLTSPTQIVQWARRVLAASAAQDALAA